ncbi:MAG: alpha/beta fold hydrolase [Actinomycetota bacterium]|nr:alpha/beta fold hydrolase [Actinomycetota bacterium]
MSPPIETLVQLCPAPSSGRAVICIPQAGAGASSFAPLAKSLQPHASVWAARFPGRERRIAEPPLATIQDMAASILGPVRGITAGTIVLFGQCSGALVAYELAGLLAAAGTRWPRSWLVACSQLAPGDSAGTRQELRLSSPPDVAGRLRALGGTPEKLLSSAEFIRLIAPAVIADFEASERYVPTPFEPVGMSIAVYAGMDDELMRDADLRAWKAHTSASFTIEYFSGGHFFMRDQEKALRERLLALMRVGDE